MTKLCECSRRSCREQVPLDHALYQQVRRHGRRVVANGHQDSTDRVVRDLHSGRTLLVESARSLPKAARPDTETIRCPDCDARRVVSSGHARKVRRGLRSGLCPACRASAATPAPEDFRAYWLDRFSQAWIDETVWMLGPECEFLPAIEKEAA